MRLEIYICMMLRGASENSVASCDAALPCAVRPAEQRLPTDSNQLLPQKPKTQIRAYNSRLASAILQDFPWFISAEMINNESLHRLLDEIQALETACQESEARHLADVAQCRSEQETARLQANFSLMQRAAGRLAAASSRVCTEACSSST